jgi:hypothetical protein
VTRIPLHGVSIDERVGVSLSDNNARGVDGSRNAGISTAKCSQVFEAAALGPLESVLARTATGAGIAFAICGVRTTGDRSAGVDPKTATLVVAPSGRQYQ